MNIDDVIAHLLVAEGFVSIDDIVATPVSELAMIQGFDEDIAGELLNRAVEFSEAENKRITEELSKLKVQDDLREAEYLTLGMVLSLAENKILCLDDLAELDSEELLGFLGEHGIEDEAAAGDIIMAARAHWFADEDAAASDAAADAMLRRLCSCRYNRVMAQAGLTGINDEANNTHFGNPGNCGSHCQPAALSGNRSGC